MHQKEAIYISSRVYFRLTSVMCQTSDFLLLPGMGMERAGLARKPGRRPIPFLFVIGLTMYQFLRCRIDVVGATYN